MAREETELLEMGARIRELRAAHGFKQQWIADQIGVQLRTYQFWQAGESPPEQENLEKLAALFGVTPKYILRGETPELLSERVDQLDRIEANIERILELLKRWDAEVPATEEEAAALAHDADPLSRAIESKAPKARGRSASPPADGRRKRAS